MNYYQSLLICLFQSLGRIYSYLKIKGNKCDQFKNKDVERSFPFGKHWLIPQQKLHYIYKKTGERKIFSSILFWFCLLGKRHSWTAFVFFRTHSHIQSIMEVVKVSYPHVDTLWLNFTHPLSRYTYEWISRLYNLHWRLVVRIHISCW